MRNSIKDIVYSKRFQYAIYFLILLTAIIVGLETIDTISKNHHNALVLTHQALLYLFTIEIVLRIWANDWKIKEFLSEGWNLFDTLIIIICFLPFPNEYFIVLRLARVFRILRLITASTKLQVLLGALFRSIPSIGYVMILIFVQFYIYGVVGTFLFAENDPWHFGTLSRSLLTLFTMATIEGWDSILYINVYGCEYGYDESPFPCTNSQAQPIVATLYFVSFIFLGALIILNLLVGIIINGMDEMRSEIEYSELAKKKTLANLDLKEEIKMLEYQIQDLSKSLYSLNQRIKEVSKLNDELREQEKFRDNKE